MLGILVVAGTAGAAFAADDDNEGWYDQRFMRSFLRGLGLQNGREGKIEYKERPPLVVPPTRNLPPPETTGSDCPARPGLAGRSGRGENQGGPEGPGRAQVR